MWIKKTVVKSKGDNPKEYYQLMESEYIKGIGSRQHVVLNLGRAERLDINKLRRLAKELKSDKYDFIDSDLMDLLPGVKHYGATFLLMKGFEVTSLRRFCTDAAHYLGFSGKTVDTLFSTVCFYFLRTSRDSSFYRWIDENFVPRQSYICDSTIVDSVEVLLKCHLVHPGLIVLQERILNMKKTVFAYVIQQKHPTKDDVLIITSTFYMTENNIPLDYTIEGLFGEKPETEKYQSIFITESEMLLKQLLRRDRINYPFICCGIYSTEDPMICQLNIDKKTVVALIEEEADYISYKDYGYRYVQLDSFGIYILRSSPGHFSHSTKTNRSYELILTNTLLPADIILNSYEILGNISNIIYSYEVPSDLCFLLDYYTKNEVCLWLAHMEMLQIFLNFYISNKLSAFLNISLSDAIQDLNDVKITQLTIKGRSRLIHTKYTQAQEDILNVLALDSWFIPSNGFQSFFKRPFISEENYK